MSGILARSSQLVYKRAWALFRQYSQATHTQFLGRKSLPLQPQLVAGYISFLRVRNMAATTIISYISAIGYAHRIGGHCDPTSSTLVQKQLCAAMRLNPSADARLPVTRFILLRLVNSVDHILSVPHHKALLRAMFVVAFFGLMRVGEITSPNNKMLYLGTSCKFSQHRLL
jgi:hypothetical protein